MTEERLKFLAKYLANKVDNKISILHLYPDLTEEEIDKIWKYIKHE